MTVSYPSTVRPYTSRHPQRGVTHPCLACGLPATKTISPPEAVTILSASAPAPFCPHCAPTLFARVRSAISLEDLLMSVTRDFDEPTLKSLVLPGTFSKETQNLRLSFSFTAYSSKFSDTATALLFPYSARITSTLTPYKPHGRPKGAADKPTSPRGKRTTERLMEKYNIAERASPEPKPSPFSYPGGYAEAIRAKEKALQEPLKTDEKTAEPMQIDDGADD